MDVGKQGLDDAIGHLGLLEHRGSAHFRRTSDRIQASGALQHRLIAIEQRFDLRIHHLGGMLFVVPEQLVASLLVQATRISSKFPDSLADFPAQPARHGGPHVIRIVHHTLGRLDLAQGGALDSLPIPGPFQIRRPPRRSQVLLGMLTPFGEPAPGIIPGQFPSDEHWFEVLHVHLVVLEKVRVPEGATLRILNVVQCPQQLLALHADQLLLELHVQDPLIGRFDIAHALLCLLSTPSCVRDLTVSPGSLPLGALRPLFGLLDTALSVGTEQDADHNEDKQQHQRDLQEPGLRPIGIAWFVVEPLGLLAKKLRAEAFHHGIVEGHDCLP